MTSAVEYWLHLELPVIQLVVSSIGLRTREESHVSEVLHNCARSFLDLPASSTLFAKRIRKFKVEQTMILRQRIMVFNVFVELPSRLDWVVYESV